MKTSLAPGSQVVTDYLDAAGLQKPLDKLGFNIVGYGCTTCIGNSGPLAAEISATIARHDLVAAAVLSGNRNFEGRVNPDVRANYLASPPLVVAYALAGSMQIDLTNEPLGTDKRGKPVYLDDIWPTSEEIQDIVERHDHRQHVQAASTPSVFDGDANWRKVKVAGGRDLRLGHGLDLCAEPALFRGHDDDAEAGRRHRRTRASSACSSNSITTDHISPGRLDQGREPGRAVSDRASGAARPTSTSTARGAATTK